MLSFPYTKDDAIQVSYEWKDYFHNMMNMMEYFFMIMLYCSRLFLWLVD